jgi:enoyl-CoA hydratase/carnithine racemase
MSPDFFLEFNKIITGISGKDELKALLISGRGRHFSSGADLPGLLNEIQIQSGSDEHTNEPVVPSFMLSNYRSFLLLEDMDIPVIAAIRGVCLGSALELALFSHFRFCGEDAVFGLPETSFNLIPGIGGIRKMTALTGKAIGLEYILRGKTFDAQEALKIGIVDRILPKRQLVGIGLDFAGSIRSGFRKEKKRIYLKNYFHQ